MRTPFGASFYSDEASLAMDLSQAQSSLSKAGHLRAKNFYWLWFPLSSIVLLIGLAWLSFSARFKMLVSFLVAIILMVMTLQLFNMVLTFFILLE